MAVPSLRKSVTLSKENAASANAESIYSQCSAAVAYIEVADQLFTDLGVDSLLRQTELL